VNSRSRISLGRCALVGDDLELGGQQQVRVLHQQAAAHALEVEPVGTAFGVAQSPQASRRTFFFAATAAAPRR
jgi:hypothetical protein